MEEPQPFRLEVLGPGGDLIAAFASPLEAWRYAALVCEPDFRPVLRRTRDGAVLDFISTSSAAVVAQWTDEREIAPPPCTAVQWSIAV